MKAMRKWAGAVTIAVALAACGGTSTETSATTGAASNQRSVKVTQAEFGDAWPFTVAEGTVRCVGASSVVFDTGGRTYAVNGTAKAQTEFPDFDSIWAADPKGIPGTKKSIGPIITKGLSLCPK